VSYFNDFHAICSRSGFALAALAAGVLVVGCGSSSSSGTTSSGGTTKAAETVTKSTGSASTPTATTPAVSAETTPTSGPLSTEPTVTVPTGPVPRKLVIKEIIRGTGPQAKTGMLATINYVVAFYHGGKVFDSSWSRDEPFKFLIGNALPVFNQGVPGMRVGGRRELITPSRLAWGSQGRPPLIPPNAPVVFVVDLLGTSNIGP
jgi:FKBP-type peptidyl-prolyl cis-trans isomerase